MYDLGSFPESFVRSLSVVSDVDSDFDFDFDSGFDGFVASIEDLVLAFLWAMFRNFSLDGSSYFRRDTFAISIRQVGRWQWGRVSWLRVVFCDLGCAEFVVGKG